MLYPVAPEKIVALKANLNQASDAENLPRPTFGALEGDDEAVLAVAQRFLEDVEMADPVDVFHAITYRGCVYALVEVNWPSPLRDKDGDMVLYTGNVPVGPDPMAMWQVLFLLRDA
jgi:hypothetical protein